MADWLREHPAVFVSTPKEPHFFATDMPGQRGVKTSEAYMALFSGAPDNAARVGEASVWYLYSSDAIGNIAEFNPDAKLIVMLRNPVEMVQSLHAQLLTNLDEDEAVFSKAWLSQTSRSRGEAIPRHCRVPKKLAYAEVAKYGMQLSRVYDSFDRGQVKVVFFDDLRKDPQAVYKTVLDFLGVADDERRDFSKVNAGKVVRSKLLARYVHRTPRWMLYLSSVGKRISGRRHWAVKQWLRRISTKREDRVQMDPRTRKLVVENYADDIRLLEALTGRNLEHWRSPD